MSTATVPASGTAQAELAASNPLPATVKAPKPIREASDAATEAIGRETGLRAALYAARKAIPREHTGRQPEPGARERLEQADQAHRRSAWDRLQAQQEYVDAILADPDWRDELRTASVRADDDVGAAIEQVRAALEDRLVARQVADAVERLHAGLGPGQLDFRPGRLDPGVADAIDRLTAVS